MTDDVTVAYVYAVAPGTDEVATALAAAVASLTGVAGAPVRVVPGGGLLAVISEAPAADFDEQALRGRLEDLDWLTATARAHDAVVTAVAARAVVLPMRLATVYRNPDRVRAMLAERSACFGELLDRLAGHVELGVKVYATATPPAPSRSAATTAATTDESAGPRPERPGAGRAYLRRRQAQLRGQDAAWSAATRLCERLEAALAEIAADRREHQPQDGRLSGVPGVNVRNVAYLVRRDQEVAFHRAVRRLAAGQQGVRVEVTGPWAPYSFAVAPEAGVDAQPPAESRR